MLASLKNEVKMKSLFGVVLFVALSAPSFAYTMNDLQGKYKLTSESFPVATILSIDSSGKIVLVEEMERFTCKGKSSLKANIVTASIKCKNFFDYRSFDFSINLSKVSDLNEFSAPLMFPMVGEMKWNFERIE